MRRSKLESDQFPYAEDLNGVWHQRPAGDNWRGSAAGVYDGPQCRTLCGLEIHSAHVSEFRPDATTHPESAFCSCLAAAPVLREGEGGS